MVESIAAIAQQFALADDEFASSALYRSLCPVVASERDVLQLLVSRRPGQRPTFLLFGAVHYLLLRGSQHRLREFYPSLGGTNTNYADAGPAFMDFCRSHTHEIASLVSTKLVQTNVVNRAMALRFGLWQVRRQWGGPVHLIDVGTSAGTHLLFDRYKYTLGTREFGDPSSSVEIRSEWRSSAPVPDLDDLPRFRVASA